MEYKIKKFELPKELHKNILQPPDLLSVTYNEAVKYFADRYDTFVFEQFEKLGYSCDEVLELMKEERLTGFAVGDNIDFYLDGEFLLGVRKIWSDIYQTPEGSWGMRCDFKCEVAPKTNPIME